VAAAVLLWVVGVSVAVWCVRVRVVCACVRAVQCRFHSAPRPRVF
jgi:hypothetical protein